MSRISPADASLWVGDPDGLPSAPPTAMLLLPLPPLVLRLVLELVAAATLGCCWRRCRYRW